MLDTSEENMLREIQFAEGERNTYLEREDKLLSQYRGPDTVYTDDAGESHLPENHYHEFAALITPQIVFETPQVSSISPRMDAQNVTEGLQYTTNQWLSQTQGSEKLDEVFFDVLMSYGVIYTSPRIQPGFGSIDDPEDPRWPEWNIIEPDRFVIDVVGKKFSKARFMGHTWVRDKESLIEEAEENPDAGWKTSEIKDLEEDASLQRLDRPRGRDLTPKRKEIVGYTIWVPEAKVDDDLTPRRGFNGAWYTYALTSSGKDKASSLKEIREPRAAFVPPWGPYSMLGVYQQRSVFPLSPFRSVAQEVEELNKQVVVSNKAARDYKRLVFVSNNDPDLAKKVAESKHDYVIQVDGLAAGEIQAVEIGGITSQMLAQIEVMRERLDRRSGITDAQRGSPDRGTTATAEAIADRSSAARVAYIARKFRLGVEKAIKTAQYYMWYDESFYMRLNQESATLLGAGTATFRGGFGAEDSGLTFSDINTNIRVHSMVFGGDQIEQARAMQVFQLSAQIAPLMREFPDIDWEVIVRDLSGAFNAPELSAAMPAAVGPSPQLPERQPSFPDVSQIGRSTQNQQGGSGITINAPSPQRTTGTQNATQLLGSNGGGTQQTQLANGGT